MHARPTPWIIACLTLAAPAGADVIVVDAAGAGDFTDLPDAIAAAAEGDTLLVKSGAYTAFELVDKGLHVVADIDATVTVDGASRIAGLSAGKTVLISGVDFVGEVMTYTFEQVPASPGLEVASCAGAVRVQDGDLTGGAAVYFPNEEEEAPHGAPGARVSDSVDVAFTSCNLRGSDAANIEQTDLDPFDGGVGGAGLSASSSIVTVNRCVLQAGDSGYAASGSGGGRGGALTSSELVAMHSSFRGGDGGWGWDFLGSCGGGGHGVAMSSTAVLRDLACFYSPGGGSSGCPGGQDVVGGTRFSTAAAPRAMFVERVVRDGEGFQAQYFGQPGDTVVLASAPETAWRYRSLFRGVWLLDRPWPLPGRGVATGGGGFPGLARPPVATGVEGTLGGVGTITVEHALTPLGPGVEDRVIWFQATMVDANGDPIVTNVQALVLVDDAF